jgi:hypothetical protein
LAACIVTGSHFRTSRVAAITPTVWISNHIFSGLNGFIRVASGCITILEQKGKCLEQEGGSLRKVRILLADIPGMFLDILDNIIASQPDMRVVGRVGTAESLLAAIRRTAADVILVRQKVADERKEYFPVLLKRPRVKVLAVAGNGKTGLLYELRPQCRPLGTMSAETLCAAIRGQKQSSTTGVGRRSR